ncbi:MAG: recombination protein RecR [Candidatus Cloacimonetes bacterium]|nr:recombination protein RecR [Candidatus Cloacimonadota bacterium]
MFEGSLEKLKNGLKQLPGIGEKTAERLAFYLISGDKQSALNLADLITDSINSIKRCENCNMLSEESLCPICKNETRLKNVLCVVERTQDIYLIEKTSEYNGRYFVLGNLISPIDGIGPNQISFPKLEKLLIKENITELILALNPSSNGETTMSFITSKLKRKNLKITRLATGLPIGGDIEYTTSKTLASAIKNRNEV